MPFLQASLEVVGVALEGFGPFHAASCCFLKRMSEELQLLLGSNAAAKGAFVRGDG